MFCLHAGVSSQSTWHVCFMFPKVLNLCRQCLLSGQSIGLLSTWKLTTHSSESTLARSKGRDLSRTLIKCYYLTYMYIYKFIYYISYDGRHFSSNKKNTVFIFFLVVGGVIAFNGPREWNFTILDLNSLYKTVNK